MKLEEVLPALRAGEVEGIRCDEWDPDYYWALRDGVLARVYPDEPLEVPVPTLVAINPSQLLGDKWSVVKRKPVEHAVYIDGLEYARIRDGRQSALMLFGATLYRPGDILLIKGCGTREVLTADVTHVAPVQAESTLHVVHFDFWFRAATKGR
jgi:hypothetical protein